MLVESYLIASASMVGATAYFTLKTRGYISTTSMLMGFLLALYGPAYLIFMLYYNESSLVYRQLANSPYFADGVISLNLSIAIMFLGCIGGIELADKFLSGKQYELDGALKHWEHRPLSKNSNFAMLLVATNLSLFAYMALISLREDHFGVILGFLSAPNFASAKDEYRLLFGGSNTYAYRLVLTSIAPFFLIWGILESWTSRSKTLLLGSLLLLLTILLGRMETLSRAPVAFLIIQLGFACLLCLRNRLTWPVVAFGSVMLLAIFYPLIRLTIPETALGATAINFFFRRAFFVPNEAVLEFFTAFPYYLSHSWGTNIRPIALLLGTDFHPAFADVSYLWRSQSGSISNSMFIADAYADFSFLGVAAASLFVGSVCRLIDLLFLPSDKSPMVVAALSSALLGVLHLMAGAVQTAMLSGGLLSVPLVALGVSSTSALFRTRDVKNR